MRRWVKGRRLRALALVLAGTAIVFGASSAAASPPGSGWSGSGDGTATTVSDGSDGLAVFQYEDHAFSGSWTFQRTATASGTVILPWRYYGFHAYFEPTVGLGVFVTHAGSTTSTSLVSDSINGCYTDPCTPPSGGFSYSGVTTISVLAGDTYGFTMTGSNGDSNDTLQGTLKIGPGPAAITRTDWQESRPYQPVTTPTFVDHGDPGFYNYIPSPGVPAANDGSWSACGSGNAICPDASTIDMHLGSRIPDTPAACLSTADFTFFQSFVSIPVGTTLNEFKVDLSGADDGARVSLYNPRYPDGLVFDGSYIKLNDGVGSTTDLSKYVVVGETNRVVITQVDDCAVQNNLDHAQITVNGNVVSSGYSPTLSTIATGASSLGGTISDSATLTGSAPNAGGSITFNAYAPGDTACATPVHTKTMTVNGDGTYTDPGFAASTVGPYLWSASYSGDGGTNTASASDPCGAPGETSTVTDPGNTGWNTATALTLDGNGDASTTGDIGLTGLARWYKVPIVPGGSVSVDLTGLPANYDVALFSDIGQAYNTLSGTSDLTKVSAEFSSDAFSPSIFSPSIFSPSIFSPSIFSPSIFSGDPTAYAGAQVRALVAVSSNDGTADEHAFADTWNNTGSFYIRVSGRNGAYAPGQPFSLHVHVNSGTCGNVSPSTAQAPGSFPNAGYKTVILANYAAMPAGPDLTTMQSKLATFASQPSVNGVIVDVGSDPRVGGLITQANAHPDCPYAKNLVAGAIKDIVSAYRASNPVRSIVLVGSDAAIPFFRYPDTAGLGPELGYVPPVIDNSASQASLQSNDVLSQDAYGSSTVLHVKGLDLPVPDLPVGRLVETPAEISKMLDAYTATANGVVATPRSSLVSGYDFMTQGANAVESDFSAGLGTGATNDTLITRDGVAPSDTGAPPDHSWTADQLRAALLGSRHDLIYLGGHFSANNTLAADFSTTMNSTELAGSTVNLTNSIVVSPGCHSGYTIVNGDAVPGVTQPLDWTEAFAQKGATLIAGTGYQYGDTDFLAYDQKLYADFSQQLRVGSGPVAVGSALVAAKAQYMKDTPNLQGIDVKSLLEATLYGIPTLSVNLPSGRIAAPGSTSIFGAGSLAGFPAPGPGYSLGLEYVDHTFTPALTQHTRQFVDQNGSSAGQPLATWYSGPSGVDTSPAAPTLPLDTEDVTIGGVVLRGVGFRGGSYTDTGGITPLTGAPTTELNSPHGPFASTAFFPSRLWSVNYFGSLTGTGGTELMLTPAQYKSDTPTTDVQRLFSNVSLRLFYSGNTTAPALSAPPTIARVDGSASGGTVTFSTHVVGNPNAGIQQVWVTYAGVDPGQWESLDLTQDPVDSTLWSGTINNLSQTQLANLRWIVQAADGVGLVSLDDNQGALYSLSDIAPALQTTTTTRTATQLALTAPSNGDYGTSVNVSATLSPAVAGEPVTFSLGGASATGITNASGVASATLGLVALPGSYTVTAGFDGDSTYLGSAASAAFAIHKLASSLSISGGGTVVPGADTGVVATLTSGIVGLQQRSVAFVLTPTGGGAPVVQTRTTDLAGRAGLGILPALAAGTYSVQAFFGPGGGASLPADPVYLPSSSPTAQLTVLPATAAGLQTLVQGLGLDTGLLRDLTNAAKNAGDQFGRGNTKQGCNQLDRLGDRAFAALADPSSPLTPAKARQLLGLLYAAETGYGCIPGTSTLPGSQQDVVDLIAAIDGLPIASKPGVQKVVDVIFQRALLVLAPAVGQRADDGGKAVCQKLTLVQKAVSSQIGSKLAADQGAVILAAVTVARLDFAC